MPHAVYGPGNRGVHVFGCTGIVPASSILILWTYTCKHKGLQGVPNSTQTYDLANFVESLNWTSHGTTSWL